MHKRIPVTSSFLKINLQETQLNGRFILLKTMKKFSVYVFTFYDVVFASINTLLLTSLSVFHC